MEGAGGRGRRDVRPRPVNISAKHELKRVWNGITIVLNVGVTTLLVTFRVSPLDQSR